MKKVLAGTIIASVLMGSIMVQAEEAVHEHETRKANMELNGINVEFQECLHECQQGYTLWYSDELLKEADYAGMECFIPADEDDAVESEVKLFLSVDEEKTTPAGLEDALAAYEGDACDVHEISEITTETLENGLLVDSAYVICETTADYYYVVRDEAEENVLYITAMMPAEEAEKYGVWFDRMVETIEFTDSLTSVEFTSELAVCSLCEEYKECGSYTVDGTTYVVCDNDYNEFAYAFGLNGQKEVCSLCEVEKECGEYTVDGVTYLVCDNDYNEFAHAFGLNEQAAVTPVCEICDLCEELKEGSTYTVDDVTYFVCYDDYNEFAEAFGLN